MFRLQHHFALLKSERFNCVCAFFKGKHWHVFETVLEKICKFPNCCRQRFCQCESLVVFYEVAYVFCNVHAVDLNKVGFSENDDIAKKRSA